MLHSFNTARWVKHFLKKSGFLKRCLPFQIWIFFYFCSLYTPLAFRLMLQCGLILPVIQAHYLMIIQAISIVKARPVVQSYPVLQSYPVVQYHPFLKYHPVLQSHPFYSLILLYSLNLSYSLTLLYSRVSNKGPENLKTWTRTWNFKLKSSLTIISFNFSSLKLEEPENFKSSLKSYKLELEIHKN